MKQKTCCEILRISLFLYTDTFRGRRSCKSRQKRKTILLSFYHSRVEAARRERKYCDKMKLIVLAVCIVQSLSLDENLLPKYLDYEQSFIRDLEEYIEIQESVLQLLRKKLLNFQVEHAAAEEGKEKSVRYFDSEINKFLILKRLTIDTKLMVAKSTRVAEDFKRNVNSITDQSDFPSQEQLSIAANAIANLQRRDKVKAERLASGIYKRVKSR